MTKLQSLQLKGIAILMMLWLHMFINNSSVFYSSVSQACNPVVFFLLISGYGYSYKFDKGTLNLRGVLIKSLKLYIIYWMIMVVFVSIGHFINPDKYPGGLYDVVANIVGFHCTYNGETWFLFPYVIITILSIILLPLASRIKSKLQILSALLLYVFVYAIMRHFINNWDYGETLIFDFVLQVFYVLTFVFYFSMGVIFYRLFSNKKFSTDKPWIFLLLLIVIFAIKALFKRTLMDGVYAFIFVYLYVHLRIGNFGSKVLCVLGKYSTGMWLTHTYYSVYLFPNYISWSTFNLVNYLTLIVVSFVTAYIFQNVWYKLIKRIR